MVQGAHGTYEKNAPFALPIPPDGTPVTTPEMLRLVKHASALIEPLRDAHQMPADRNAILDELRNVLVLLANRLAGDATDASTTTDWSGPTRTGPPSRVSPPVPPSNLSGALGEPRQFGGAPRPAPC
jgi:hypothetical protein